jgi:NSS family neurotransmitter:Na+ symporter
MGGAAAIFGVIFFLMLLTLGIDSAFSMTEALSAGLEDLGWEHEKAVRFFCIIGLAIGLIFVTGISFWLIHLIDHFAVGIGIVLVGLIEVLAIGYVMRPKELREFINENSEVKIGKWWDIMIRYVTPFILMFIILWTLKDGFVFSEEAVAGTVVDYPTWLVFAGGYGLLLVLVAVALFMQRRFTEWA